MVAEVTAVPSLFLTVPLMEAESVKARVLEAWLLPAAKSPWTDTLMDGVMQV